MRSAVISTVLTSVASTGQSKATGRRSQRRAGAAWSMIVKTELALVLWNAVAAGPVFGQLSGA